MTHMALAADIDKNLELSLHESILARTPNKAK